MMPGCLYQNAGFMWLRSPISRDVKAIVPTVPLTISQLRKASSTADRATEHAIDTVDDTTITIRCHHLLPFGLAAQRLSLFITTTHSTPLSCLNFLRLQSTSRCGRKPLHSSIHAPNTEFVGKAPRLGSWRVSIDQSLSPTTEDLLRSSLQFCRRCEARRVVRILQGGIGC
ncbi:hypothetical protein PM082_006990 [Marasmius tenuissimus]|nr:hypothetical protein PM082_006990 [Marasmius tenuissimus]